MKQKNCLFFIYLVFTVDFTFGLPSFVPPIAPGLNVADLTKGIQQQVISIAKQVKRLKRAQFTEDAEEEEDIDEDRFRSGFIPEESPVSDTSKIEAPKETATPAFSSDQTVTTEATVQWQPSSDSSDRGIVHFGDDREEANDRVDQSDSDTVTLFKGDKGSYCTRYEQHFSFYCVGDVDKSAPDAVQVLEQFCPSYKKNCPDKAIGGGNFGTWPANPFSKEITVNKSPSEDEDEPPPNLTKHERYTLYMKRRVPCREECDQRIYPHCTEECKCDYAYPSVQKFCNPPPLPLFLQTCRIWYNKCPKYEQYHYASQYIYSKAEKGKVLPGIVPKPVNPYNIPQPGAAVSAPSSRSRVRAAASRSLAPRYEDEVSEKLESTEPRRHSALADAIEMSNKRNQPITTSDLSASRRILHNMYRQKLQREIESTNKKRKLRDDIQTRSNNYGNSEALIVPPDITENFKRKRRAKANQGSIPIIPSEAASSSDAFKDFDAFTDSRGVAHRPRSRSPWSKPGLWEPNPDDPHNRDHANKFYYHPQSVTADWVNGQLAWGAHWAVPAAGTGGSDGYSVAHFPSLGHFLNIPDDYD